MLWIRETGDPRSTALTDPSTNRHQVGCHRPPLDRLAMSSASYFDTPARIVSRYAQGPRHSAWKISRPSWRNSRAVGPRGVWSLGPPVRPVLSMLIYGVIEAHVTGKPLPTAVWSVDLHLVADIEPSFRQCVTPLLYRRPTATVGSTLSPGARVGGPSLAILQSHVTALKRPQPRDRRRNLAKTPLKELRLILQSHVSR